MIALVLFAALLDLQVESSSSISGRYSVQIGSEDRSGVLVLDVRGSRVRGAIGPTDQAPPFENGSNRWHYRDVHHGQGAHPLAAAL
jgi:hypothetical protein